MQSAGTDRPTLFQEFNSVFHIIKISLQDIWEDIWSVLVINLVWTLCVLTIVPGPPATLALFRYANRLAHGEIVDVHDFIKGFKQAWAPAWRWGTINLFVIAIFVGDTLLSNQKNMGVSTYLYVQSFYIALLVVWLLLQTHVLAFMIEQEQPVVKNAFRNSIVMLGKNFSFSIAYNLELILIMLIGVVLFMIIFAIGGVLLADVGNRAVLFNLKRNKQN
ncbi:MAG: DUF624 domain-containing protein [Anaerolineaceae bacterium]